MPERFLSALKVPLRLIRAGVVLLFSPRLLRWCIPPWLLGGIASWAAFDLASAWIDRFLSNAVAQSPGYLQQIVSYLGVGAAVIVSALFGLVCALVAGSFFLDLLVEEALLRSGARLPVSRTLRDRASRSIRALGSDLAIVSLLATIGLVGFLLSFLAPLAILSATLGIGVLGFELADKPLSILEIPFRARLTLVRRHGLECWVMGGMQSLVVLIPGANLLLLPVFYVLAADVVVRWDLERPPSTATGPSS